MNTKAKVVAITGAGMCMDERTVLKCIEHAKIGAVAYERLNKPKRKKGKRKAKNWDSPYPS